MSNLNFVALAGRAGPASELLRAIVTRHQQRTVERDGQLWTPVRRAELMTTAGLTPKQFRTAITKLKTKRLVLFRMAMHEGCKMPFFALGAAVQSAQKGTLQTAPKPILAEQGALLGTPYAGAHAGASFNNSNNIPKEEDNSNELGGLTPTEPEVVPVTKSSGKSSVLDIAAALKAKGVVKAELSKPLPLAHVWRNAVVEHTKSFVVSPGPVEIKLLKQAAAKAPPGEIEAIIDYVVKHWSSFLTKAQTEAAAFPLPGKPAVGFFRKHIEVAVNLWLEGSKPNAATLKVKALFQTTETPAPAKPVPPPEPENPDDKMPTKEELMKILGDG